MKLTVKYLRKTCHETFFHHWRYIRDTDDQPFMRLDIHKIEGRRKFIVSIKEGDIQYIQTVEELEALLKALKFIP